MKALQANDILFDLTGVVEMPEAGVNFFKSNVKLGYINAMVFQSVMLV